MYAEEYIKQLEEEYKQAAEQILEEEPNWELDKVYEYLNENYFEKFLKQEDERIHNEG